MNVPKKKTTTAPDDVDPPSSTLRVCAARCPLVSCVSELCGVQAEHQFSLSLSVKLSVLVVPQSCASSSLPPSRSLSLSPPLLSPSPSVGVADGVGGWRDYGVDPSQFSETLMRTCERLVKEGRFTPSSPVGILTSAYYELLQNKVPLLGKRNNTYVHIDW